MSVLKQIHDDLDAAVADAYGWPADLPDDEILRRLVAFNAERAEEEKRGLIRWLRPEFQNPGGTAAVQEELALPDGQKPAKGKAAKGAKGKTPAGQKTPWPKTLAEQARSLRAALVARQSPVTAAELAKAFKGATEPRVAELLDTLATLGQARPVEGGRFAA